MSSYHEPDDDTIHHLEISGERILVVLTPTSGRVSVVLAAVLLLGVLVGAGAGLLVGLALC